MGIRAISRFTRLDTKTVLNILESAGEKCARFLDEKVRNVNAVQIQADEIHTFVKSKCLYEDNDDPERGTFFTFLSMDRDSKLIINWRVSKRKREDAFEFMKDLSERVAGKFQLSTDGFQIYSGYRGVVREVFGETIDYATEIKVFLPRTVLSSDSAFWLSSFRKSASRNFPR
jgi:hypothetical protein